MAEKRKRGRPSDYTPEMGLRICERMAGGESLRKICADPDMPDRKTVTRWALRFEDFRRQYAQARELLMEYWADEIVDIADDGTNDYVETVTRKGQKKIVFDKEHVMRSRLRVDTRRWIMSKLAPKRFGDKVAHEHSGPDGGPIRITKVQRVIIDPRAEEADQGAADETARQTAE